MRVIEIKNTTKEAVKVRHSNGVDSTVPPGTSLFGVDIINADELVGKGVLVQDLSEVKENDKRRSLND